MSLEQGIWKGWSRKVGPKALASEKGGTYLVSPDKVAKRSVWEREVVDRALRAAVQRLRIFDRYGVLTAPVDLLDGQTYYFSFDGAAFTDPADARTGGSPPYEGVREFRKGRQVRVGACRALIPVSMSRSDSFRVGERTANEVHATLCAMVTTQAASFSAWSAYESVLLDPATGAFFAARLSSEAQAAEHSDGESNPPSKKKKKRKLRDDGSGSDEEADDGDPVEVVCEHCGGAVPEVSLRVACLDGTTLDARVAQSGA